MPDADQGNPSTKPSPSRVIVALDRLGRPVIAGLNYLGGLTYLLLDVIAWMWRGVFDRRVRIGRPALYSQIVRVGVRSVTVIALVSGAIGLILALQMAPALQDFGQVDQVATIIAIAVVRELGPLISAIVLTGFAGAAIAAELGTMVVGEEIEALRAHALNPTRFLVLPRIVATTLCLIVITVFSNIVAIGGGYLVGTMVFGIPPGIYRANTLDILDLADLFTGLTKAGVFGTIIGAVACYNGLNVTGGAAGVGRATTNTVVQSIVAIILADFVFTTLFFSLGWT